MRGLPPELIKAVYSVPAPVAGKVATGTASLADGNAVAFVVKAVQPGRVPAGQESQIADVIKQAGGQQGLVEFSAYVANSSGTRRSRGTRSSSTSSGMADSG